MNILRKYTRRFGRSLEDSRADDLVDPSYLSLQVISTAELMEDALLLTSVQNRISPLTMPVMQFWLPRLALPLVTADKPLAKAIDALWIGDLDNH
ncbi:MAG: hypothetical protein NTZ74_09190 [Chloroflexi bacterium]|nr:hypothetical protein [Chloroflexota bacterium]